MFLIELGSKSPHGEGKITFRPLVGEWMTHTWCLTYNLLRGGHKPQNGLQVVNSRSL